MKMGVRSLSSDLAKKAEKEINEKPQEIDDDITAIRDWLSKQSHLERVRPSDQWLVAFLRGSKFSLERCKEKMEMYYTIKTIVPEFFGNRDPCGPRIQEILKLGVFLPLKNCPKVDSPRTCIMRLGVFDPSRYHLSDVLKVALMITEILMLEDDNFSVCGEATVVTQCTKMGLMPQAFSTIQSKGGAEMKVEVIIDLKDVGVNVLSQWTPALAKKILTCFEKALPVRVKGNHILNTPTGFETAYALFKSFLGEKLKKRMNVHNKNYNAMYKIIPKTILPVEYGGTDGDLLELINHWKAKVESYRDWFLSQEEARSDETKRTDGTIKNSSTMFGIEGSFRQLKFD